MTISRGLSKKVRAIKFSKSHRKSQYMCSSMGKVHQTDALITFIQFNQKRSCFPGSFSTTIKSLEKYF